MLLCILDLAYQMWLSVQVGSLVPAESAELHVVDAVHTRMGASDNLAMGSSTFLEVTSLCVCDSHTFKNFDPNSHRVW